MNSSPTDGFSLRFQSRERNSAEFARRRARLIIAVERYHRAINPQIETERE